MSEYASPSTFLIQSHSNSSVGTGFCIDRDDQGSYLVTCAHVVEECGRDDMLVGEYTAHLIAISDVEVIDLALIYIEGLVDSTVMELCESMVGEEVLLDVEGFKAHHQGSYKQEQLSGVIKKVSKLTAKHQTVDLYELTLDQGDHIEKGYSGSAIVLQGTHKVIGVATDKSRSSQSDAYAIPITHLKSIVTNRALVYTDCSKTVSYKAKTDTQSWMDIFSNKLLNTVGGVIVVGIVTSVIYDKYVKEPDITPTIVKAEANTTHQKLDELDKKLAELQIFGNKEKFLQEYFGNDWQQAIENPQTYHNLKQQLLIHEGSLQTMIQEKKELLEKIQSRRLNDKVQNLIDKAFAELRFEDVRELLDTFIENNRDTEQDLLNAHYQKALSYMQEIKYHEAKEEYETYIPMGIKDTDILHDYGTMYYKLGEYDKYLEVNTKRLALLLEDSDPNSVEIATAYNEIGLAWQSKGEYDKAIEYFTKTLNIFIATLGEQHPSTATSYNNIGSAWRKKREYDKAIEYYTKSLNILIDTLGEKHPNVASSYNNIGLALESKGEYDKAIEYYTKTLNIFIDTLGEQHPSTATSYNNIGMAWRSKGEYDKAIEYHTKALDIRLATLGEQHPDTAISYNNIGLAWKSKGEYDKAIEYYTKALDIKLATLGEQHPATATTYNNIAWSYYYLKNFQKAYEFMEKAVRIREVMLPANHPYLLGSKQGLETIKAKLDEQK